MKHTQTIAGVLVLLLLGAGVYWVRSRNAPSPGSPAATAHAAAAPTTLGPGQTLSADEALPDLSKGRAAGMSGDVMFVATLEPHPPVAFAPFRLTLRAEVAGAPSAILDGKVAFEMVMPMGDHRYALQPQPDGTLQADVTLPMCMSGNPRWFATVEGVAGGVVRTVKFRLDLVPRQ
jgi:hypothetical protein